MIVANSNSAASCRHSKFVKVVRSFEIECAEIAESAGTSIISWRRGRIINVVVKWDGAFAS
jgi:hypothetical protein